MFTWVLFFYVHKLSLKTTKSLFYFNNYRYQKITWLHNLKLSPTGIKAPVILCIHKFQTYRLVGSSILQQMRGISWSMYAIYLPICGTPALFFCSKYPLSALEFQPGRATRDDNLLFTSPSHNTWPLAGVAFGTRHALDYLPLPTKFISTENKNRFVH